MVALGMCDRAVAYSPEPLIIEDARPQSGHMQACHPASVDGFFEPTVQPGQRVAIGDRLGTITDTLGERTHEIRAVVAGVVLTLQMFASVRSGDGLAVVLETNPEVVS
jgi:predicted deacylase